MITPALNTDLLIEPKSRMQALTYALGISGYGLREVLTKSPIRIPKDRIIRCTKVPWFWRSYFVLEFQTDMPSSITLWELPSNAAVELKDTKALRFYLESMFQDWRNHIKTFAAVFFCLGVILLAIGMLYYTQFHPLPKDEQRRNWYVLLSLYSVIFPFLFYRFVRPSMRSVRDLRSLQIQTAAILGLAVYTIFQTIRLLL